MDLGSYFERGVRHRTEARFRDTIREVIFSDNIVMDTMDTLMPPS